MNRRSSERGAALLVAMVSIAVLTALAVDLAYESRVSLQIAANSRDELRASYVARSGVALSRLVLSFQQKLDLPASQAGALGIPRVQIWRMVPVGSELAGTLFPGSAPAEGNGRAAGPVARFEAVIEDEGRKVNAQLEAIGGSNKSFGAQVQALYQLVCDPRWDPLFEREDARGVRVSREDLLVYLRDWVDGGEQTSALRASSAGTSCGTVVEQWPFEDGFGDENQPYDRGEDRYRAKNARMDSLDEVYLVAGVSDAFMAAFGDALTVYLPRDTKQNINTIDREELKRFATLIALGRTQPLLFDPTFAERLHKLVLERTIGGIISLTPAVFADLVETAGITVNRAPLADTFTDQSTTFRIRASGTAGGVRSAIDAVLRLGQAQPAGTAGTDKIIHWREE